MTSAKSCPLSPRTILPPPSHSGLDLMTRTDSLADFPQLGRVVPEQSDENTHEIILRPYRIIYQVMRARQVVAIARIWHGARGEPEIPARLET